MSHYLHIKKFICKVLTFWLPYDKRIFYREALFWFSLADFLRFKRANYHIVSLGANCLPRGLATAIKLKPRRFYGEKTCVFDFYISDLKRNIELLENNFSDFFSNIDKKNFIHDKKLSDNEFVKRYERRIENFKEVLQSNKITYFIYSDYAKVPQKDDILRLYNVLKNKRKSKPFKLILLTTEYISDLPDIIQFPYDLKIDDDIWLIYMVDEYKEFKNKYTRYAKMMKDNFEKIF